jgi:anti-sigma factor RsiW
MAFHLSPEPAGMTDNSAPAAHPTDEHVAGYLDGVLPSSERAPLEAHLAGCEYCRARLALAVNALRESSRARSFRAGRRIAVVGLAAAAALAGVLLLSRSAMRPGPPPAEIRAPEPEAGTPPLLVVEPVPGSTVSKAALRFVWKGIGADVLYQVTVSAADGRTLWSTRSADTLAVPTGALRRELQPGQSYFWRVDALLANLRSVTSGDRRFEVSTP